MKRRIFAGLTAVLAVLLVLGPLRAQETPKPLGDVEVTVAAEGGKRLKSGRVYVGGKSVDLSPEGRSVLIGQVQARKTAITAEGMVSQGWFRADLRYIGVTVADLRPGAVTRVAVSLVPLEPNTAGKNINDFCLTCHPNAGDPTEPGQITRDVHKSGLALRDRSVEQVKKYNSNLEKLIKEGKPHGFPIRLEDRQVLEAGKKVKRSFFTCESCHTTHIQTPSGKYTVAVFRERSDLCLGCHY